MVFIRSPIIEEIGPGVEVLATDRGRPVLVRQGKLLIATFHPELTSDTTVHEYFLKLAAAPVPVPAASRAWVPPSSPAPTMPEPAKL
jgi:5'-phosphate synthase pdxT subunit